MLEHILADIYSLMNFFGFEIRWFANERDKYILMYAILIQFVISVLLAFSCWRCLPLKFREPCWPILALLFSFSFFIPILGAVALVLSVLMGLYFQLEKKEHPFLSIYLPEFDLVLHKTEVKFGVGGIKSCLNNSAMPERRRLQALLTMQSVTARTSNPVLQNLLNDSGEDIRLVSYGLLDGREKKINHQIHEELNRLGLMQNSENKIITLRHLAELEWEFAYTGLAQGDLRKRALSQALGYLEQALAIDASQPGLWFLKGRVQLERQFYTEAKFSFEQAQKLGFMPNRLYSYLAELAFVQRDFRRVKTLLELMQNWQTPARMEAIMQYWFPLNLRLSLTPGEKEK